jgi:hypothetical protein
VIDTCRALEKMHCFRLFLILHYDSGVSLQNISHRIRSKHKEEETMDLEDVEPEVKQNKLAQYSAPIILYSATLVMVLARSVDFVLYIRMATKMVNYEYILADILLSVGFMMSK